MYYELSKREKKIARVCIDKGPDEEFREGLEKFEAIIRNWRNSKFISNKEAYHQLYKTIEKKNNAISKRYDGLTGSRWLITIAAILKDGYISENDLKDLSDETKAIITNWNRE